MKEVLFMNRKLQKKDKISLGILAALIVIVIGAGAFMIINNTNNANKQTEKITSGASKSEKSSSKESSSSKSSSESSSKTSSKYSAKTNPKTNPATEAVKKSSASSSKASASNNSSSSKTSSKTSKSSNTSSKSTHKGDKVKRVKPKENTSHASNSQLQLNGKTCYVGDTITVVMNIKSQKSIINYQGDVIFDSKYLKIKNVKSNDFGIANTNGDHILYNASSINGMDFSGTGTVFTATFEVKEAGSTKITNDLQIISELVDNNIKQLSESDYSVSIEVYA